MTQTAAWIVAHAEGGLLTLTSPGGELYLGPFANICDLERVLTRLSGLDASATASISRDNRGRTRLRFSDGCRFLVNSGATSEVIVATLQRAKSSALVDQRDPQRRRFEMCGAVQAYTR